MFAGVLSETIEDDGCDVGVDNNANADNPDNEHGADGVDCSL